MNTVNLGYHYILQLPFEGQSGQIGGKKWPVKPTVAKRNGRPGASSVQKPDCWDQVVPETSWVVPEKDFALVATKKWKRQYFYQRCFARGRIFPYQVYVDDYLSHGQVKVLSHKSVFP